MELPLINKFLIFSLSLDDNSGSEYLSFSLFLGQWALTNCFKSTDANCLTGQSIFLSSAISVRKIP